MRSFAPAVTAELDRLAWETPARGLKARTFRRGTVRIRLLEFSPGFVEPAWCRKAHQVYVLAGGCTLQFPDRDLRLKAGQVVCLPSGLRHKVRVRPGERASLLVFDRA